MSDDADWIDAGETTGVGTDIGGCLPWIIGIIILVVGLRHLCEFVPEAEAFLRDQFPGFFEYFAQYLGI